MGVGARARHLGITSRLILLLYAGTMTNRPFCQQVDPLLCKLLDLHLWLQVLSMYMDCDRDSLVYLADPIGPACHTNAPTCYFTQLDASSGQLRQAGDHQSRNHAPLITLYALEQIIAQRRAEAEAGGSTGELSFPIAPVDAQCYHHRLYCSLRCQTSTSTD
jgi:endogenous inhibitor of DNA gyrase (YacG/DUF329 family)